MRQIIFLEDAERRHIERNLLTKPKESLTAEQKGMVDSYNRQTQWHEPRIKDAKKLRDASLRRAQTGNSFNSKLLGNDAEHAAKVYQGSMNTLAGYAKEEKQQRQNPGFQGTVK